MAGGKCMKMNEERKDSYCKNPSKTYWGSSLEGKQKETFIWRLKLPMSKRVFCLGISGERRAGNSVWYAITVQTDFYINLLWQVVSWYCISRAILCSRKIHTWKENYNTKKNRSEGGEAIKKKPKSPKYSWLKYIRL